MAGDLLVSATSPGVQVQGAYYITYYSSYKPNSNANFNHDLAIIKVS